MNYAIELVFNDKGQAAINSIRRQLSANGIHDELFRGMAILKKTVKLPIVVTVDRTDILKYPPSLRTGLYYGNRESK